MKQLLIIAFAALFASCQPGASQQVENTVQPQADREPHRPEYHFSPPSMWMNDPNGMVYLNGEYHLFYQHYPDSTVWGPMHWGHAVSRDMIHWQHLPIALYPDSLGYIFSGSAVVDKDNTSGLGTKDNPAMVAIFTYHKMEGEKAGRKDYQSQGIAFSVDNGRTWEKYAENPVIKNPGDVKDFRDPKVFWHKPSKKWVMILAVGEHVEFYGSKDLISWNNTGEFGQNYVGHGGVWECPDLFPLKVASQDKWVMLLSINPGAPLGGSGTQYFIGNFDGKTFKSDNPTATEMWLDYGKDNYAGVTWSNVAESDGRRLFMGWMSNWQYANLVPTENWRNAMTIPRVLRLSNTEQGLRLLSEPVKELEAIREEAVPLKAQTIEGEVNISEQLPFSITTSEVRLTFDRIQQSQDFGIQLSNAQGQKIMIGYEADSNRFYVDRTQSGKDDFSKDFAGRYYAPRLSTQDSLKMHLLIDVASVELFADNGQVVMTDTFFPDENYNQMILYAKNGSVQLKQGEIHHLTSIWNDDQNSVKK